VDLSQTVIFLTSNLGSGQIADLVQGGMGFVQSSDKPVTGLQKKVESTAVEAARRKFSPEFMNRLDKVVVFHPLKRKELDEVLEIELGNVQKRVLDGTTRPFLFRITEEGREFLLQEGTDQRYGARHLKRAIERFIVYPIARLMATAQVHQGDALLIDRDPAADKGLAFLRDPERGSSDSTSVFAAGNSSQLATAEVGG
jgi:ATP-dependent Clp protease ATP-binding subunit ClpA